MGNFNDIGQLKELPTRQHFGKKQSKRYLSNTSILASASE
jgi:hypothetical protein